MEIIGFVILLAQGVVTGLKQQGRQLVLLLPIETYDLKKEAFVGVAWGMQWWIPGAPIVCKLVNRGKILGRVPCGHLIACLVAINTRDSARFNSPSYHGPSTTDPPSPCQDRESQPRWRETRGGWRANFSSCRGSQLWTARSVAETGNVQSVVALRRTTRIIPD